MPVSESSVGDEDLERRVHQLLDQQRAIGAVLRAVARRDGLQPVLDEIVESCRRLCDADNGALWLLGEGVLEAVAHQGEEGGADYDRDHPHAVDRASAAGRTALTRAPVHIPDADQDPEYVYHGPRYYRAMLGMPILGEDELIGVVVVVRRDPVPYTEQQIALMQTFADQAAVALTNARLIDAVERQRTELARFVSPQVAALISSEDGERMLAGHRAYISCMFCDLRGFTAFAETAAPEELFEVLGGYHGLLGSLIPEHEGTLEHFAGDGVMIFFNDPVPVEQHELHAARLAQAAHARFEELAEHWRKRGTTIGLGVGIEAGYATLGRIGFPGRYDYGVIGPVANLASRLSTHAAAGQTLVGPRAYAAVESEIETRAVGRIDLKGFGRPIEAYELRRSG
jgi:class 3 adenylate cyclase